MTELDVAGSSRHGEYFVEKLVELGLPVVSSRRTGCHRTRCDSYPQVPQLRIPRAPGGIRLYTSGIAHGARHGLNGNATRTATCPSDSNFFACHRAVRIRCRMSSTQPTAEVAVEHRDWSRTRVHRGTPVLRIFAGRMKSSAVGARSSRSVRKDLARLLSYTR